LSGYASSARRLRGMSVVEGWDAASGHRGSLSPFRQMPTVLREELWASARSASSPLLGARSLLARVSAPVTHQGLHGRGQTTVALQPHVAFLTRVGAPLGGRLAAQKLASVNSLRLGVGALAFWRSGVNGRARGKSGSVAARQRYRGLDWLRIGEHAGSVLPDRDDRQHYLRRVAREHDAGGLFFGPALLHHSSDRISTKRLARRSGKFVQIPARHTLAPRSWIVPD
jgi:hypothetical protein